MEIERIRKELNHLLENVVEHSGRYSEERPIPSLEISFVLAKINKMQENLSVLRHLLEEQEKTLKHSRDKEKNATGIKVEDTIIEEEPIAHEEEKVTPLNNLEEPPIPKLIDALTLNDRYLYANELFDKDMNAFNDLVKTIDNSSSKNEATELIASLDWDDENEHVMSFINLVERRFI